MRKATQKLIKAVHGANLTEYSLVVGLIAVVSIGAVYQNGEKVAEVFCTAANSVGENTAGALNRDFTPLAGCEDGASVVEGSGESQSQALTPGGSAAGQEAFVPEGVAGFHTTRDVYTEISSVNIHAEAVTGTSDILLQKSLDGTWITTQTLSGVNYSDGDSFSFDLNTASGLEHGIYGLFRIYIDATGYEEWFWNVESGILLPQTKNGGGSQLLDQTNFSNRQLVNFNGLILSPQLDQPETNLTGSTVDRLYAYDAGTGEAQVLIDDHSAGVDFRGGMMVASDTYIMTEGNPGEVHLWDGQGNLLYNAQLASNAFVGAHIEGDKLFVAYRTSNTNHRVSRIDIPSGTNEGTVINQSAWIYGMVGVGEHLYITSGNDVVGYDMATDSIDFTFTLTDRPRPTWGSDQYFVGFNFADGGYDFVQAGASSLSTSYVPSVRTGRTNNFMGFASGNTFFVGDRRHDDDETIYEIDMTSGSLSNVYDVFFPNEPGLRAGAGYQIHVDDQGTLWGLGSSNNGVTLYDNGRDAAPFYKVATPR